MKKIVVYLFFLILFIPQTSFAKEWNIPPAKTSESRESIMIFITPKAPNQHEIKRLTANFPTLILRYIYTEVFTGFSVIGEKRDLDRFCKSYKRIKAIFEANTYKTDFNRSTNNQLIGTDIVRGHFDRYGNHLTGKGVKIGIIDTGIDYTHPDLSRNYKGGYDFIDDDQNPMESLDSKGMTIHGTHVSGIVAADGDMQGVAPEADLYCYRVLGPGGTGTTDQVLAAIEQSIKDKMDVINLSLGTDVNGPDLPVSLALNKAVSKGIIAVTSNGNSGPKLWTVGSPGTSLSAISVGASTPVLFTPYLSISSKEKNILLTPLLGSKEWNFDHTYLIADGGMGKNGEMKRSTGKIILIRRGEITFTEKVKNAAKAGAVAVIIVNNTEGGFTGVIDKDCPIPAASVSKNVGEGILKKLHQKPLFGSVIYKEEKDRLADFSSRGPVTVNWSVKPDVTAPGVSIKSTIPHGHYAVLQGTSMAAPYVAGAAALIKQAHPNWGPPEIKAALMNTAKPLFDQNKNLYKVYEQGAGRIQIDKAVHTKSLVIPGSLSFGIINHKLPYGTRKMKVKNTSESNQNYHFKQEKYNPNIRWEFPHSFALKPGETKTIWIKAILTRSFNPKKEMHDGQLVLEAGSQKIPIPYLIALKEPSYPRIMGFQIVAGDRKGYVRYEAYLPTGAEEFGIALFDSETMSFIGLIDRRVHIGAGMVKNEMQLPEITYLKKVTAVAFARNKGEEDYQEWSVPLPFIENGVSMSKKLEKI